VIIWDYSEISSSFFSGPLTACFGSHSSSVSSGGDKKNNNIKFLVFLKRYKYEAKNNELIFAKKIDTNNKIIITCI